MTDVFTPKKRSEIMSKIRSKGTKAEILFESKLKENGIRYKTHSLEVEGKPDFIIEGRKIAIFIDGEFWHGKLWKKKNKIPNSDYWKQKISKNIERDKKVNKILKKSGWQVLRFWETNILKEPDECIEKIVKILDDSNYFS